MSMELSYSDPKGTKVSMLGLGNDNISFYGPKIDMELSMSVFLGLVEEFLYDDVNLKTINVNELQIKPIDFMVLIYYVFTNTSLQQGDPRLQFVSSRLSELGEPQTSKHQQKIYDWINTLNIEDGYMPSQIMLQPTKEFPYKENADGNQ